MTQVRGVGSVLETPKLSETAESELPRVLGEILEWQSGGRLDQLTDGRYYMADTKHENIHSDKCRPRYDKEGNCHSHENSHVNNHTDTEHPKTGRHTDRGPKPPAPPREPGECIGKNCW